jgi:hypothetical protein
VIPKHEYLGDLVTTDTEWYRPMVEWLDKDEMTSFQQEMGEQHKAWFGVVEQGWPNCTWGFSKTRPLGNLIEENGEVLHIEETWDGRYLGTRFNNDELIEYGWLDDDMDSIPVVIDNDGRCEGVINMEGDRCDKRQWKTNFCATCQKYDDKVKAGKLRKCKYCSSTYHSTRSCEQNPKVIEKNAKREAWVAQFNLEAEARRAVNE